MDISGSTESGSTIRTRTEQDVLIQCDRIKSCKEYDLDESVERAKKYISGALAAMLDLGKGSGPMNHGFAIKNEYTESKVEE